MCRPDVFVTASSTYIVMAGHCRPEFGINAGKSAIIVRTLYGLKNAGAVFCAHLASFMCQMGYASCKADPDFGIRLRPGLMTTLGIMPTYYVMLTTFYVYTTTL